MFLLTFSTANTKKKKLKNIQFILTRNIVDFPKATQSLCIGLSLKLQNVLSENQREKSPFPPLGLPARRQLLFTMQIYLTCSTPWKVLFISVEGVKWFKYVLTWLIESNSPWMATTDDEKLNYIIYVARCCLHPLCNVLMKKSIFIRFNVNQWLFVVPFSSIARHPSPFMHC